MENSVMSCATMDGSVIPVVHISRRSVATLCMTTLGSAAYENIRFAVRMQGFVQPQPKLVTPTIQLKYLFQWQQTPAKDIIKVTVLIRRVPRHYLESQEN